jgi:hypothetical protein
MAQQQRTTKKNDCQDHESNDVLAHEARQLLSRLTVVDGWSGGVRK